MKKIVSFLGGLSILTQIALGFESIDEAFEKWRKQG